MQFAPRKSPTYLVSRITSISRAPPPRCAGDTRPKVGPSAMRPSPATARAGGTWCGRRSVGKGCGGVYDHPRPPSTHRLRPTPHLTPIRAHSVAHRVAGRRVAQGCTSRRWPARGAGRQKCGEFAADFTYKVVGMDDVDPLNPPPPARNHPPRPSARRPRTRLRWGKWSVRDDSVPNRILYLPSLCDEKIGRFGSTSGLCP